MKKKIHHVMPMAGKGSRFFQRGYHCPKPLITIYGNPFFYWATRSIQKFFDLASLDFVVLKEHVEEYAIDQHIGNFFPDARVHMLDQVTQGAVISCLEGLTDVQDDCPIVFNDCDHLFMSRAFNTYSRLPYDPDADGILLTFAADQPKYSFIEKDEQGRVIRTAEKQVISDEAICGCYYFRNKDIFCRAAEKYLIQCAYSEYFMSGVYNVMISEGQLVRSIKTDFHVPFGTPEEYEKAQNSKKYRILI